MHILVWTNPVFKIVSILKIDFIFKDVYIFKIVSILKIVFVFKEVFVSKIDFFVKIVFIFKEVIIDFTFKIVSILKIDFIFKDVFIFKIVSVFKARSLRITNRLRCQDCMRLQGSLCIKIVCVFKEVFVSHIGFIVKIVFVFKEVFVSQIDFVVKIVFVFKIVVEVVVLVATWLEEQNKLLQACNNIESEDFKRICVDS
ncbi:hypothetical protein CFP56_005419 [Quercus suber]|uniref:Uncharacterized protein n=1 Tax=Quercus suber TaxID=58331 RepID=A0AAW0L8Z6_QUESU